MIIKTDLAKYLPKTNQETDLDPFPTLRHALEWLHNLQKGNQKSLLPTASEIYLANALMGAQRSVLEQYTTLSKADFSKLIQGDFDEEEKVYEAVAENASIPNKAFSLIHSLMNMDFGSPEEEATLKEIADSLPPAFQTKQSIISLLEKPAELFPDSLDQQAQYIVQQWQPWLGKWAARLLRGLDYYSEEHKARFDGPGPPQTLEYSGHWTEAGERFSPDQHWMPGVVMVAKNTLVWLDQLSKSYNRDIKRLDQIPEEELDKLASYGFNALWLIGLWERSQASKTIKHWCGNVEAESSAYSVKRYQIADLLGGESAMETLRYQCSTRGIRLASDMVPNHTSLDSDWMMDHPDWFISRPDCPYPSYNFSGKSLSENPSVGLYLEDHYFSQSDAAVVFKRVDHLSGEEKYIYHGNDGTSMPWNDTAQLNYLNRETREAVIQTILHVARQFPIIRFDAAMTLAKKHFQRLWFPIPGTGSDVASRADFGMTKEAFDAIVGEEFWREVVDRVAKEVPDTLLLAEAFWMMEGFFVRSLGMHRVYNSAFMNMLKMEENGQYRLSIKQTLEFDPEILKRFVNFMNNPDEEPAVIQFGDGDKYFGVATLLVTMPGLPMWGHGQTEGFHEKYGMEYIRSYWDENPDQHLVERHQHEIFPLIKKRYLFADSTHFRLYDFYTKEGFINENVFAYSNSQNNEYALIIVNNAYESTAGNIRFSVPFKDKAKDELRVESITDAFRLHNRMDDYVVFQEQRSGLEYLRRIRDIADYGFYAVLNGYESQVYLNFNVWAASDQLHFLYDDLNGRGVASISSELLVLPFRGIHQSLDILISSFVDNNAKEIERSVKAVFQTVDKNDRIEIEYSGSDKIIQFIIQHNNDVFKRYMKNRPEWFKDEMLAATNLLVVAQSMGNELWWKLYDEAMLDRYINIKCGLTSGKWETLLHQMKEFPKSIFELILQKLENAEFLTLMGYNEWEGNRYIQKDQFEEFLSVCYLLDIKDIQSCHAVLVETEYLFDKFIEKIEKV
ncbi:MAG: hypothetical protein HQ509_00015 [Candidatus Marinimicrobia bacterium]|nr:hypothetical protein [Candidatus Neomarinimicrobiota bacterium]